MDMFGTKSSKKASDVHQKGQASHSKTGMNHLKKSAASTIAVYGTSTIVGKVKAN
jgi:hypothetical protein